MPNVPKIEQMPRSIYIFSYFARISDRSFIEMCNNMFEDGVPGSDEQSGFLGVVGDVGCGENCKQQQQVL